MTDALIHLRVPAETKARWVRDSRTEGKRLTDWIIEKIDGKDTAMNDEGLIKLLDTIIEEHTPTLINDAHRVYLASIARGYRLMKMYGTKSGDVPAPGPGFDEWFAGNALYADACNKIRETVGSSERDITHRIRALVDGVSA